MEEYCVAKQVQARPRLGSVSRRHISRGGALPRHNSRQMYLGRCGGSRRPTSPRSLATRFSSRRSSRASKPRGLGPTTASPASLATTSARPTCPTCACSTATRCCTRSASTSSPVQRPARARSSSLPMHRTRSQSPRSPGTTPRPHATSLCRAARGYHPRRPSCAHGRLASRERSMATCMQAVSRAPPGGRALSACAPVAACGSLAGTAARPLQLPRRSSSRESPSGSPSRADDESVLRAAARYYCIHRSIYQ